MSTKKINNLQREVSEVTHLLKDNVEKVLERGDNLDRLQTRSENLEVGATSFHRHAVTLKKTMCCKNFKMGVVLCIVVLLLIAVIVAVILATTHPWEKSKSVASETTKNVLTTVVLSTTQKTIPSTRLM